MLLGSDGCGNSNNSGNLITIELTEDLIIRHRKYKAGGNESNNEGHDISSQDIAQFQFKSLTRI